VIPVGGTIPRCPHSIYLATPDEIRTGKAHFCSACNPMLGTQSDTREFIFPTHFADNRNDRRRANKTRGGACPNCSEMIHTVVSAKVWQCVECGTQYKATRRKEAA